MQEVQTVKAVENFTSGNRKWAVLVTICLKGCSDLSALITFEKIASQSSAKLIHAQRCVSLEFVASHETSCSLRGKRKVKNCFCSELLKKLLRVICKALRCCCRKRASLTAQNYRQVNLNSTLSVRDKIDHWIDSSKPQFLEGFLFYFKFNYKNNL